MTLSPALRDVLAPAGAGRRSGTGPLTAGTVVLPATGTPLPGATPITTPVSLPGIGATPAPKRDKRDSDAKPADREKAVPDDADGVAGGEAIAGALRPGELPTGPALGAPGTTTMTELPPTVTSTTPDAARRYVLRVVGVEQTVDLVKVKVAIASGPDKPAETLTIALKPSTTGASEGQAVKVSLDVVAGDTPDADPQLRVRVTVVDDTSGGGAPTATVSGDTGTSTVVDVSMPVTSDSGGGEPGEPTTPPDTGELLIPLGPTESSSPPATGSTSAPASTTEGGTSSPAVTVEVSVEREPTPSTP
ncbi:MAG: hypothetical protein JHC95_17925, partial [Solirubrobacteraceae bacterium]|nr:hypothetical protein [Solirubrobacteraceae bacterium]